MNEEIVESVFYDKGYNEGYTKGYDKGFSDAMENLGLDFEKAHEQGYQEALLDLKNNLKEINKINESIDM